MSCLSFEEWLEKNYDDLNAEYHEHGFHLELDHNREAWEEEKYECYYYQQLEEEKDK